MAFGDGALRHIDRQKAKTVMLLQSWAGNLEAYAKQKARWEDRTGHARQGLHAGTETQLGGNEVTLYLSHSVEYGIWLEIAHGGKNAIINPTLDAHLEEIKRDLEELWS